MKEIYMKLIMCVLLTVAAIVATAVGKLYSKYVNTSIKKDVVGTTVKYVEQVFKSLHGQDKLLRAMSRASEILKGYGIYIEEIELITMIEAAVAEFNDVFKKTIPADGKEEPPAAEITE